MPLEPFAGVLVSMARSVKAILDQGLQIMIARAKPGSKSLDIHRSIITELELPHSVRDLTFAAVESLDFTTKYAIEIKIDLSGGDSVHLSVIIDANISNQQQQVVEGLPDFCSNVFISVNQIVVA